jgi:hypothetical protein
MHTGTATKIDMSDETEPYRRARITELNFGLTENKDARRAELEAQYGRVWSTDELGADFEALGFMAPFVIVRERATGRKGTLEFTHSPRFYFSFEADR